MAERISTRPSLVPERASSTDAGALAALATAALPGGWPGWDRDSFASELASSGVLAWIVRATADDAERAATAGLIARALPGEIELRWLAVRPDARRAGYAGLLVDALLAASHELRASVFLEVRVSNAAARALYTSRGFVVAGRRARYYRDGEDALVLRWDAAGGAPDGRAPRRPGSAA